MTGTLVPPAVEAHAQPRGRLPVGFGPRFFVFLLIGLVWLVPAWWSPNWIAGMWLWDAVALFVWLFDLQRLPAPERLLARRIWKAPLVLARAGVVEIELRNGGAGTIRASLVDETPASVRDYPPTLESAFAAESTLTFDPDLLRYDIVPRERGDLHFGDLFMRYRTNLGFAERRAVVKLAQTVRVLPDLIEANDQALFLIRSRQVEMERRRKRQRGMGREFESLREYRPGDDMRHIYWPTTARRHQLTTRVFETERSQTVWIVVDAGRLLRARVVSLDSGLALSKLDYSVNAALSLARVALQTGDRVGLLAYGHSIQQSVNSGHGRMQTRSFVDSLAQVRAETMEANHALAARTLLTKQKRRSLVVWITDFAETPATPDVIESAAHLSRRHLVVFAAVSQPDLAVVASAIPQNAEEMFRHAAALEIVQRRDLLLRDLRRNGILAMDLTPGILTSSLVNQYLDIKDRSLL